MENHKTVSYDSRERMQRDVEKWSDRGWVVVRITKQFGDNCEVEYERRGEQSELDPNSSVPYLEGGPLAPPHYDEPAS